MKDYNALGITVRYLAFPRQGLESRGAGYEIYLVRQRQKQSV